MGAWTQDRQFTDAAESSITYSNQAGDALRFAFDGSAITYVYTKAPNRGIAQVRIDGRVRAAVDLYSASVQWQAKTAIERLDPGVHMIEIQVTKRKDPASSDYFVDLDRFIVE